MKTFKIAVTILTAAVLAASCQKAEFLNRVPYSSTTPENFYSNSDQMKMALISCYETINTHKIPGLTYCQRGSYSQGLIFLMNAPSDDVVGTASSMGEGVEMEQCNFDEGSLCIRHFWKVFYAGINRCNIILHYIDGIGDLSDAEKLQIKAEARFLRAFFYYHLAWNFGGVPIVTDFASTGEEPRSSLEDVYTNMIFPDLEFAYKNLDPAGGYIEPISVDRYVAAAYIGKICNYLAACKRYGTGSGFVAQQPLNDFAWVDADAMSKKAKTALEDVCLNGTKYSLNPDFTINFLEGAKVEQYQECMLLAEQPISGVEGYWPNSFYLPLPAGSEQWPTAYGGRHIPTYRMFYMFSPKDSRRDWTLTGRMTEGYYERKVGSYTYGCPQHQDSLSVYFVNAAGDTIPDPETGKIKRHKIISLLYDSPTQSYNPGSGMQICTGKFRLAKIDEMQRSYQLAALSYPLMRLADVYLMYAEAIYFADSNEGLAREWMNKVLRRAATDKNNFNELVAAYHRDDFVDELIESRSRELFMEFSRKWDLIRFNRIDEAIATLNPDKIEGYTGPMSVEVEEGVFAVTNEKELLGLGETNNQHILISSIQANWRPYKIWLPISEEQIGVNKNLTQNAGW